MSFMFFGHPGSRFSIRGLSKACEFYVFQASRVSIKHPRLSGTLVFLMFFGVQDPDCGEGLSGGGVEGEGGKITILGMKGGGQGWRV